MAEKTKIQWTDHTFNSWRGCMKVSPGCANCYAERVSKRNPTVLGEWGSQGTRVLASPNSWLEPYSWDGRWERKGSYKGLVFCASLADVFEDWPGQMSSHRGSPLYRDTLMGLPSATDKKEHLPPFTLDDARKNLWATIEDTPNLRWQILTKRPENIAKMMPQKEWPNVWLGTSVESQEYAWRLDCLNEAPQKVPVRFCSAEPLLGDLDLGSALGKDGINWVIVGGESGRESKVREFHYSWCKNILGQCRRAGVPCFVKQTGSVKIIDTEPLSWEPPDDEVSWHGDTIDNWPLWMQVREVPDF